MSFPSHEAVADALLAFIYLNGGTEYQIAAKDTYEALADYFELSTSERRMTRDEDRHDGHPGLAWHNRVQWARQRLLNKQYLVKNASHGIWKLSPLGKAAAGDPERVLSRVGEPLKTKPIASRRLSIKDDQDLAVLSVARTLQMQRLHNAMTNALLTLVGERHAVYEGNCQEAMFDALILDYKGQQEDLLIEVKSSTTIADVRLAVGQLLDYRRFVYRPNATDLAVLLPEEPGIHVRELLQACNILCLWFADKETLSCIQGTLESGQPAETKVLRWWPAATRRAMSGL